MGVAKVIPIVLIGLIAFSIVSAGAVTAEKQVKAIIVYNDKVFDSDIKALQDQGGVVKDKLDLINGVVVTLPQHAFDNLVSKHGDRIKYVEEDQLVQAYDLKTNANANKGGKPTTTPQPSTQTTPWGIEDVNAEGVWTKVTGSGIKIAVVDTGIYYLHPDLQANVKGGVSFVKGHPSYLDDNGHGTHVAGTIAAVNNNIGVVGVAPGASLYAVKVLNSRGSGYTSDVISGINWAVANDMDVITMSLGSSTDVKALHDACDAAYNAGVVVVAAAGNSNGGSVGYPAAYDSVIAVSAVDSNNNIASFSSIGPEVDIAAPGVSIYSTYLNSYATLSGTSMATPHVTGVVTLILDTVPTSAYDTNHDGHWQPAEVMHKLNDSATDLGATGFDTQYGYGLVNAVAATA